MDKKRTIEILEALASGFSPLSGEMLTDESILNDREVIRALQQAIDLLQTENVITKDVQIIEEDINEAIRLFKQYKKGPTSYNLVGLFLASRQFKDDRLLLHSLYGKYKGQFTKGQLLDFFDEYLFAKGIVTKNTRDEPYRTVDYFQKEKFNKLSEAAINQLKQKIQELGILKTEDLSEHIVRARTEHSRAYEAWSDSEKELLAKAIHYTNDLDLLSECFLRGKNSIESVGQKIIFDAEQKL